MSAMSQAASGTASEPTRKRRIFVGDVQGCRSELEHRTLDHDPVDVFRRGQVFVSFESDDPAPAYLREALGKTVEELPLPARAINALKNADVHLVADLAQKTEADLEHLKNLGEKSIDEIKAALASLGLSLGMRIDPNVLGALNRTGTGASPLK